MKLQQRINKLKKYIYNPNNCTECFGTGINQRKKNHKLNGCARCVVGKTLGVRLPEKDFLWIIKKLERDLQ